MPSEDNEIVYFIRYHFQTRQKLNFEITSFNIRTESFVHHFGLSETLEDFSVLCFFWWNNSLAIGSMTENGLRLSALDNNNYAWGEIINVPLAFLSEDTKYSSIYDLLPVKAINNDLWFHYKDEEEFCYDRITGKVKKTRSLAVTEFEYRPSLKFLQGMQTIEVVEVN